MTPRLTALYAALLLTASAALPAATPARKAATPARKAATPAPPPKPFIPAECIDFYTASNREWLSANPALAPNTSTSALGQLASRSVQQQRDLLDQAMTAPQNAVQKALGDFWASGLDEIAVEADGIRPITPLLGRIEAIRRSSDVPAAFAALHQVGIPVGFNFAADIDLDDTTRHIGYFSQGGLGLPDPAFYTRNDAEVATILAGYRKYVGTILTLTGSTPERLPADIDQVMGLESALARASMPVPAKLDTRALFSPVPTAGLRNSYRNLQLAEFLKVQGITDDRVSLANAGYFQQLDQMVKTVPAAQWKTYLRYQVGNAMAPYLTKAFRDAEQQFRGPVFRGETAARARWQQVLDAINTAAGPMLGHEYAARYLPMATRQRAAAIANVVRLALQRQAGAASWLSPAARTEAQAKIDALKVEIGLPARNLDYTIQPMGRGSFGSNMLIASTWWHAQEMHRIGRGNADRRWDVLPQVPALGYDTARNRLIVTAAMLQPPVLDMAQPPALQFGSYGALAAREMARAIDAQGRLVDARGLQRDWWAPTDLQAWQERLGLIAQRLGTLAYPALPGRPLNGMLVREQAALDRMGLTAAWSAFADGGSPSATDGMAFFQGWARLWPQQEGLQAAALSQASSPYLPGMWRVNAALAQMPEFAQAWRCPAGQPMVAQPLIASPLQ